jgi:GNAT superfamily N-acetyltransferase
MNTLTNSKTRTYAAARGRYIRRPASYGSPARPHTPVPRDMLETRDGNELMLRPIDAGDVDALKRGFARLTPGEVRMRFLHPLTELPEPLAQRLCNLDPQNEVAFVLIDPPPANEPEIHAVARVHVDPVALGAEFALIVQHHYAKQGLGTLLMQRLIAAARELGAAEMWGDVLLENSAMLDLCSELGFERRSQLNDPGVVRVTLDLANAA